MIDLIGTIRWIKNRVDLIFNLVNAILTLQETGGTITTDGNEQDVYRVETPMGVFQPLTVQIDFTNNTAAETVVIRTYYRIVSGGNYVKKDEVAVAGVPTLLLKNVELEPNRFGVRVTMQRTAGGAQSYDWCVFFRS